MTRRTIAAFDFDGTMTRRDTLVPFLASFAGSGVLLRALAQESRGMALAATGRGDRDAAKERVLTRVLAGVAYDKVQSAGRAFGADLANSSITDEARHRIAWHRREGHEVVIVSASLDVYLREVADVFAVSSLLCTGLHVDEHGRCTGRLLGANCRGAEKAARLRTLIGSDDVEVWAYGNSAGDEEMLALADHPVRVRRGRMRRLP